MPGKRGGVTVKELQAKAKAAKIKGWSKMRKAELMQRVGGGGGGGAPQRKKGVPVTTAKRYEAKGVAGKIVSKIGANLTDSGKKNLEAVLMKRVKSATDKARRQPGATDQSVRKAAAGAVKDVVRDVRSQSNSKRTRAGNPTRQQQALEKRLFQERDQNADATLARQRTRERAYMERSFAEEEGVVPKRQRKSKKSSAKPVAAPNDEAKRRARKTGKQVSVTRNLDYNPGEGKRDIHKATLTGSTEKGGMESRRPKQATAKTSKTTAGTPQKQKSSTRKSSTASTPQKQKKTRSTATTSRKKMTSAPTRKAKGDRLTRANRLIDKMNEQYDRIDAQASAAKKAGDWDTYRRFSRKIDAIEERRLPLERLVDSLSKNKKK